MKALKTPKITRDVILFTFGLVGVGWETFAQNADRPTLLLLFGAMIGLPAFLKADEARKEVPPVIVPNTPQPPAETDQPMKEDL